MHNPKYEREPFKQSSKKMAGVLPEAPTSPIVEPLSTNVQAPQPDGSPLVRMLPRSPGGTAYGTAPTAHPHRWEQRSERYPAELLQMMEADTSIMRALTDTPTPASRLRRKLRGKKRRVPEMRQVTAVECGAACVAMILNYYGYAASVSEVLERCGVGRDGLTALEIVKCARLYGLRTRTVSLDLNDFRFVTLPAIVHWEFNHFLVVERWSRTRVIVVDPALGRRTLSPAEFDEGFTGVVMMLEPGAQFEQKAPQKSLSLLAYMRSFLRMRVVLAQILGTSLLLQILGLGGPLLTEVVIDRILPEKDGNMLIILALGMLILVLMQGIAAFLRASLLIYLQTRIDTNMMLNFFEHLLSLPYRFFQLRLNGDLLARMNSNIAIRDVLTNQLISTLLDGSTVVFSFILLFYLSKIIAGLALVLGITQVLLLVLTAPPMRRLTRRDLEAQGKTQGYMNEVLAGIATIKAAGAEQRVFQRWEGHFFNEMNISLRLRYLSSIVSTLFSILNILAPLLLLWVGALQVIAGHMSIGTMLALNTLAVQFLIPLAALATSVQELQVARAHFARIADVIDTPSEQDLTGVQTPHCLSGQIELKHVSFRYDQHTPVILQDINLKIYAGQKVALVGRTGSGKSTLGKLLIGLITPTTGTILFDGVPLDQLNYQEVRAQFGCVLQESFVFSGSVRDNISLNNPTLDMERILEAAHLAAIASDIDKMPMGYETIVSEGGSAFSGGQRQRLALARALVHRPSLLLLDEATSSLDVVTEQTVEHNLRRLPCTQIVIAHRLSTIRNADLILVLDNGQIVEQGTHTQLLRQQGYYARLIQTQLA